VVTLDRVKNGIGKATIRLVRHGICLPEDIAIAPDSTLNTEYKCRLVFVGRIEPIKGVHIIIQTLKELPNSPLELDIYAVGSQRRNDYYNLSFG